MTSPLIAALDEMEAQYRPIGLDIESNKSIDVFILIAALRRAVEFGDEMALWIQTYADPSHPMVQEWHEFTAKGLGE